MFGDRLTTYIIRDTSRFKDHQIISFHITCQPRFKHIYRYMVILNLFIDLRHFLKTKLTNLLLTIKTESTIPLLIIKNKKIENVLKEYAFSRQHSAHVFLSLISQAMHSAITLHTFWHHFIP